MIDVENVYIRPSVRFNIVSGIDNGVAAKQIARSFFLCIDFEIIVCVFVVAVE